MDLLRKTRRDLEIQERGHANPGETIDEEMQDYDEKKKNTFPRNSLTLWTYRICIVCRTHEKIHKTFIHKCDACDFAI